jgi:DNA-binding response OmpR family regulator
MTSPKRILIADDDESLVDSLARRCEALGLCVQRAYDGMSALMAIDALDPDLVILDVNMPGGSGLSVCEMVAHDPDLKSIPTIILTGRTDGETINACKRLAADYVLKGANTWAQLEPLLIGRLQIDLPAAVMQECTLTASREPGETGKTGEPEVEADADRIQDRYLARIFAALGWPASQLDDTQIDNRPEYTITKPWVLCVDDDPDFAATLKLRLQQHGVEVLHAFAGMEGYRLAFTHGAQAIILDQELPNGKGEYILRRLKESSATAGIPVIVLTGTRDQALARRMYNLGATRFLTKPVDWESLWVELQPLVASPTDAPSPCQAALN